MHISFSFPHKYIAIEMVGEPTNQPDTQIHNTGHPLARLLLDALSQLLIAYLTVKPIAAVCVTHVMLFAARPVLAIGPK
ncbi:MAG: hypothetical protein ABJN40_05975 [Sneathiella sp.]